MSLLVTCRSRRRHTDTHMVDCTPPPPGPAPHMINCCFHSKETLLLHRSLLLVTTVNSRAAVSPPHRAIFGHSSLMCSHQGLNLFRRNGSSVLFCLSIPVTGALLSSHHFSLSHLHSQLPRPGHSDPQQPAGHCISEIEADSFALICLAHAQYLLHLHLHHFVYRIR